MAKEKVDRIEDADGKAYGPCSGCAFYRPDETRSTHATGRCHGAVPNGMVPGGWPVVEGRYVGCGAFKAAK